MVRFSLVVTEKFSKGTDVRLIETFATREEAERIQAEKKFVGRRGTPFIIEEQEFKKFQQERRTGIFKPTFVPPTQAELQAAGQKQKAQERFEKLREGAKTSEVSFTIVFFVIGCFNNIFCINKKEG